VGRIAEIIALLSTVYTIALYLKMLNRTTQMYISNTAYEDPTKAREKSILEFAND